MIPWYSFIVIFMHWTLQTKNRKTSVYLFTACGTQSCTFCSWVAWLCWCTGVMWCDFSGEVLLKSHYKLHGQSKEITNPLLFPQQGFSAGKIFIVVTGEHLTCPFNTKDVTFGSTCPNCAKTVIHRENLFHPSVLWQYCVCAFCANHPSLHLSSHKSLVPITVVALYPSYKSVQ